MRRKVCYKCRWFDDCLGENPTFSHHREPDKRQTKKLMREEDYRYCKGFRYSSSQERKFNKELEEFHREMHKVW